MPTIDFGHLLFGATYDIFSTAATLTIANGDPVAVNVIDKTDGIETTLGSDVHTDAPTIMPAAIVRASVLADLGIAKASLRRGVLEMNGKSWRIDAAYNKPTPAGEADGEIVLILMEASA